MYREWDRCGFWQFVPLQHCSRYCFVFCLWDRSLPAGTKKYDAAAQRCLPVWRLQDLMNFVLVALRRGHSVSVVRDIFLYPAARSRMDTHTGQDGLQEGTGHPKTGK